MKNRSVGTAVAIAGISALLCAVTVTPAQADVPSSWESQALDLPSAQQTSQGEGITVAFLGTGVVKDHPALVGKVTTGPDFVKGGLKRSDPRWGRSGTARASEVLKVAPQAEILSIRVIDGEAGGESTSVISPIAEGVNYAVDHDADVIFVPLIDTFSSSFDEDETTALARAAHAGVPVLAPAGNDGDVLNGTSYPAAYPGVIAVAAVGKDGKRAEFSTVRTYNSVAAPGVRIVSAKNTGGYEPVSGTSPATALTAGVVALMLDVNGDLTSAQVRSILTGTASHPPGGWNPLVGYGTVDAAAAVQAASEPPADGTVPAEYEGKEHLATPNDVSPVVHPAMETGALTAGLVTGSVGLMMVIGAILIGLTGRRRKAAATPTPPGPAGPWGYPGQPR